MVGSAGTPELTLVTSLYRTTNAIVRELDQRLGHDHDVTFIQAVTLLAIDSFDRPQPHLVADYLSQQSQTVTGVLDRLERAGHLVRKRDMEDRRAVRLELTAAGKRLAQMIRDGIQGHLVQVLTGLDAAGRDRLTSDLGLIERTPPAAPGSGAGGRR